MRRQKMIHVCLFDRECWHDWWAYGMPMRIYYHPTKKFWNIPILYRISEYRTDKVWDLNNGGVTRKPRND